MDITTEAEAVVSIVEGDVAALALRSVSVTSVKQQIICLTSVQRRERTQKARAGL